MFLRHHRHELFDEAFRGASWLVCTVRQNEGTHLSLRRCWRLSLILEAYTGVSDDEVIEATVMDRRWQLVLDCLDCEHTPFSKGTLSWLVLSNFLPSFKRLHDFSTEVLAATNVHSDEEIFSEEKVWVRLRHVNLLLSL